MSEINDLIIAEHIEQTYGIKGIGLQNLSDVFNPKFSKNFDIWDLRNSLLQKGMSRAQINKIMEDRIFELNDFGKGPFRMYQLIQNSVKIEDYSKIDFTAPLLQDYRNRVVELTQEAQNIKNSLKIGLSPISYMQN